MELRRAALGLFLALLVGVAPGAEGEAPRPNVLLILCDDLGWSDLGCYGGEIETPHLDGLAAEGMRFTQFYNNAKCTTTRASLMTGLYPRGAGNRIASDMLSLAEALRHGGYRTSLSGKWHLGRKAPDRPIDRGFDEAYGLLDGCCNFFDPSRRDPKHKGGRVRVFAHNEEPITEFPDDYYTTDAFTDHAIETIERFAEDEAPFFVHVCYTAPHYPLHAPPEDIAKYRGRYRDVGWDELRKRRHARQIELGLVDPSWTMSEDDSRAYPWSEADHDWEDHRMAVYAAMVDRMDQGIGRLLATLERLEIADDTLVLFLSDNGGCSEEPGGRDPAQGTGTVDTYTAVGPSWGWAQNAPFRRYKAWAAEGGISTPFLARWPKVVEAGSTSRGVAHVIDVLPTLCELAGVDPVAVREDLIPIEGRSFEPLLRGRERDAHDALYWFWGGNCAVRQGKWKLVWDKLVGRCELFDLETDRTETRDLASEHPERVSAMQRLYEDWAAECDRKIPWTRATSNAGR